MAEILQCAFGKYRLRASPFPLLRFCPFLGFGLFSRAVAYVGFPVVLLFCPFPNFPFNLGLFQVLCHWTFPTAFIPSRLYHRHYASPPVDLQFFLVSLPYSFSGITAFWLFPSGIPRYDFVLSFRKFFRAHASVCLSLQLIIFPAWVSFSFWSPAASGYYG